MGNPDSSVVSFQEKAVYFFLILLPFSFALNPLPGIDLALNRVLALILISASLIVVLKRRSLTFSTTPLSLFLALFLLWACLSLVWAPNASLAVRKLIFLLNFLPLFWLLPTIVPLSRLRVSVLLYPGLIVSLIGIVQFALQFIIGLGPVLGFWRAITPFFAGNAFGEQILKHSSWLVNIQGTTIFRATALFPDGHIFGFYLAFIVPLALYQKRKFIALASILALLFTLSRQAYVGAIGVLLVFLILSLKFKRQNSKGKISSQNAKVSETFKFYAVVLSFSLCALSLLFTSIGARLLSSFNLAEGSNTERLANWAQAGHLIADHPLIGVGIGNYVYTLNPLLPVRTPVYAHNLYLDIGAELGLVGLFLFTMALWFALVASYRKNQFVFFTLVWFCLQSLFDTPLYSVHILPLLVLFLAMADGENKFKLLHLDFKF